METRIENLEEMTSLSLLELDAATKEVTDANGLNRFKSGFVVTDFADKSIGEPRLTTIDNIEEKCGISPVEFMSMNAEIALDPAIDPTTTDLTQNLRLQIQIFKRPVIF